MTAEPGCARARQLRRDLLGFIDGLGHRADGCPNVFAGFAGLARELAHFVSHHGETAATLASPGGFNGRIQRQQVGLVGDFADLLGHAAEVMGVAGDAADLADQSGAVGLGLVQGIDDLMQPLFGLLDGFDRPAALQAAALLGAGE